MPILRWEIERNVPVSTSVVQWNYVDGEHLSVVHSGYSNVSVLYEDGSNSLTRANLSVPVLRFIKLPSTIFVSFPSENTQVTYAHQMFIWSKTTISLRKITERETSVKTIHEFDLTGWRSILYFPLRVLIPRWNQTVWEEDLPVKLRRQQMIDLGFRDFVGLPETAPAADDLSVDTVVPLRRPDDSPISRHPFFQKTTRRVNLSGSK